MKFRSTGERFHLKEFLVICWRGKYALATPFVVLGGIYAGVFTPVEASVIAVLYALGVGAIINRKLKFRGILESLTDATRITGTVIIIVGTSMVFGQILTMNQAPLKLAQLITHISTDWFVVMLMIIAVFFFIGMFMETLSTIIILTPVLLPVVIELGIHPIFFGIIFVLTNEVAFLTPPLGVNLFVACQLADVSIERLSLHVLPHIFAIVVCILFLTYFPQIILWLPRLLGYGVF